MSLPILFFWRIPAQCQLIAIKMAIQILVCSSKADKAKSVIMRNGLSRRYLGAHGGLVTRQVVCHSQFAKVLPQHLFCNRHQPVGRRYWLQDSWYCRNACINRKLTRWATGAVIVESLVQWRGGMRFYCPEYLRELRSLCDQHNRVAWFLMISSTVWRTGHLFAYESSWMVVPDMFMSPVKRIERVVIWHCSLLYPKKVAEGISADGQKGMMHGPTYGVSAGLRVACESIEYYLTSDWQTQVSGLKPSWLRTKRISISIG